MSRIGMGLVALLTLATSVTAFAAKPVKGVDEPLGLTVATQVGAGGPLVPGAAIQIVYGGDLLYSLKPNIALGAQFSGSVSGSLLNTASVNSFLATVRFLVVKGFYLSPEVGVSLFTNVNYLTSTTTVDLALGAEMGYDFRLSSHFGIGPELAYLFAAAPAAQPTHLLFGVAKIRYSF